MGVSGGERGGRGGAREQGGIFLLGFASRLRGKAERTGDTPVFLCVLPSISAHQPFPVWARVGRGRCLKGLGGHSASVEIGARQGPLSGRETLGCGWRKD